MVRLPRVALEAAKETQPFRFLMKATPRPLIKWKSFWLGILVLGFLGWALLDSFRYETNWAFKGGSGVRGLYRLAGATIVFDEAPDVYFLTGFDRLPGNAPIEQVEAEWRGLGVRYVKVPDSFFILSFLVLWSAWLLWHWRREQKKVAFS